MASLKLFLAALPLAQVTSSSAKMNKYLQADCAGAIESNGYEDLDTCDEEGGDKYVMTTCNSTGITKTYYTDKSCSTLKASEAPSYMPLGCMKSSSTPDTWMSISCGASPPNKLNYLQYSVAGCPEANQTAAYLDHGFVMGCRPDGNEEGGAWKAGAEEWQYSNGKLTQNKYDNNDCSAPATTSLEYSCSNTCTVRPDNADVWYKMSCNVAGVASGSVQGASSSRAVVGAAIAAAALAARLASGAVL